MIIDFRKTLYDPPTLIIKRAAVERIDSYAYLRWNYFVRKVRNIQCT